MSSPKTEEMISVPQGKPKWEEDIWGRSDDLKPQSPMDRFWKKIIQPIDGPVTWFRENIVLPNQHPAEWYHEKFNRVPTVDECYADDPICIYEAHHQYKRDRKVDSSIVEILRSRFLECEFYHGVDSAKVCDPLLKEYKEAETNWFAKYGDLCFYETCINSYMKQKHRMIWERRQAEKAARESAAGNNNA